MACYCPECLFTSVPIYLRVFVSTEWNLTMNIERMFKTNIVNLYKNVSHAKLSFVSEYWHEFIDQ